MVYFTAQVPFKGEDKSRARTNQGCGLFHRTSTIQGRGQIKGVVYFTAQVPFKGEDKSRVWPISLHKYHSRARTNQGCGLFHRTCTIQGRGQIKGVAYFTAQVSFKGEDKSRVWSISPHMYHSRVRTNQGCGLFHRTSTIQGRGQIKGVVYFTAQVSFKGEDKSRVWSISPHMYHSRARTNQGCGLFHRTSTIQGRGQIKGVVYFTAQVPFKGEDKSRVWSISPHMYHSRARTNQGCGLFHRTSTIQGRGQIKGVAYFTAQVSFKGEDKSRVWSISPHMYHSRARTNQGCGLFHRTSIIQGRGQIKGLVYFTAQVSFKGEDKSRVWSISPYKYHSRARTNQGCGLFHRTCTIQGRGQIKGVVYFTAQVSFKGEDKSRVWPISLHKYHSRARTNQGCGLFHSTCTIQGRGQTRVWSISPHKYHSRARTNQGCGLFHRTSIIQGRGQIKGVVYFTAQVSFKGEDKSRVWSISLHKYHSRARTNQGCGLFHRTSIIQGRGQIKGVVYWLKASCLRSCYE